MAEVKYYKITYRAYIKSYNELGLDKKVTKRETMSHGENIEEAMGKVKSKLSTGFIEFLKVELVEDL